ncbi:hypothetical protein KKC13_05130 [bacterium]|nr:hypothetical protein [bacterium]MBU1959398.1 hypothetical protein [bacterium]
MKLYYYAFTGHKNGLDRVKRAAVVLNKLRAKGIDTMLLVNDFRAGLVAKEFGVPESVTIETIQDIDAIAEVGDSVIIDSPEDDHGRLVKYCSDFKEVFRFAGSADDKSIHGEIMMRLNCDDEACISSVIVDDVYFEEHKKENRTLFFLSDSDADKTILKHAEFFKDTDMELLLGHYFYVKYEDELSKIFKTMHEPEEYMDLICSSSRVVTASFQTALEARVAGAEVIYIELNELTQEEKSLFSLLEIITVINFNKDIYQQKLLKIVLTPCNLIEKNETIVGKIINRL